MNEDASGLPAYQVSFRPDVPITFRELSWALFDIDQNAVLSTQYGSLAIFSSKAMALLVAAQSSRRIAVLPVSIRREGH